MSNCSTNCGLAILDLYYCLPSEPYDFFAISILYYQHRYHVRLLFQMFATASVRSVLKYRARSRRHAVN
jgi:hypothetical protein